MDGDDIQNRREKVDQHHSQKEPVAFRGVIPLQKIHEEQHDCADGGGNTILRNKPHGGILLFDYANEVRIKPELFIC